MSEAQELIPMTIAKAMNLIVHTSPAQGRAHIQQVICQAEDGGYEGGPSARFVGTNGHVMLIVDTKLPAPEDGYAVNAAPDGTGKVATSDLAQFISSKGHRKPEFFRLKDRTLDDFPDYKWVIPTGAGKPVARIGFDVSYMDMMVKIHKALKLGSAQTWAANFDGALGTTMWSPARVDDDLIRGVTFIIMPVRLDE
jgi:hypothetical protein